MSAIERLAPAVAAAERRLREHLRVTELMPSLELGKKSGATVLCKLENLQPTGSFKVRGALNALLELGAEGRGRGIVAASTGNHGAAVAWSLARLGAPGLVYVSEEASPSKVRAIERWGVEVRRVPGDPLEAELAARREAEERGGTYLSPYNGWPVVAGQGTAAVELARQAERIDAVYVALGGGGLAAGIAGYLKSLRPEVQVIGCSPENSPVMIESVKAGRILDLPSRPTLSDGTAGGLEPGAITFELCRELIDGYVTVSEAEIRAALLDFMDEQHLLIEGAAAVAIAGFLEAGRRWEGATVALVICGGNLGLDTLRDLLCEAA